MIDFNPIAFASKPKVIDNPPEIFKVDELRALLQAATRVALDVVPMLAIGGFAGLHNAEIQRLDWSEVDLPRGHVDVLAAMAKSARRRGRRGKRCHVHCERVTLCRYRLF